MTAPTGPEATLEAIDPRQLRNTFGTFATGVTVVTTTGNDSVPHGATVNAFTAVSLEPPLAQVTLTRQSKTSPLTRPSATPPAWSPASTTASTTRKLQTSCSPTRTPAVAVKPTHSSANQNRWRI